MDYDALWAGLLEALEENPQDIITVPLKKEGRWFCAYAENGNLYVESSMIKKPSCVIKTRRKLNKKEFAPMAYIFRRRLSGAKVSKEASQITRNQVYWYGIFSRYKIGVL